MEITKQVQALVDEGNKRGLYNANKLGPELVAFFHDRAGMLASLRDEVSEGYQSWVDECVAALEVARDRVADTLAQSGNWQETLNELARLEAENAAKDAEIAALKDKALGFIALWATQYARDFGLPDGSVHPTHHDVLLEFGARPDAFARAALEPSR